MSPSTTSRWTLRRTLWASTMLVARVAADQVLQTTGFTDCGSDPSIIVNNLFISYDNGNKFINFDVAGTSVESYNVSATLEVNAYGKSIFSKNFNPCESDTFVEQLCPLPAGPFSAHGSQQIPDQVASMVPAIAFQIPDIAAEATLKLNALGSGRMVACIESPVTNGKTVNLPAVTYAAAGIAGAALLLSGASAIAGLSGHGVGAGMGVHSPGFTEVTGVLQGMAMNGMLSVNYPPIYRNFAKNFAFSTGLMPWNSLLSSIDTFRARTGGNLTDDSVAYLRNTTLRFPDGSTAQPGSSVLKAKRAAEMFATLVARDENSGNSTAGHGLASNIKQTVSGIQAYVEELSVPKSDVFMTALLVVAIIIGIIVVGILLIKVILETWALYGNFPQSLSGFRQHYWRSIARTITSLVLLLYGVWVLYCVFQFTLGDSWAAKALAGVSLGLFTALLAWFTYKIWSTARKLRAAEGDASRLFDDKSMWVKYSMFYEAYRKSCWWAFIPTIAYMLVKGCVLAGGDGKGMQQTAALVVIEAIMLGVLIWSRPFERRSGNVINIVIQAVRLLSIVCILVFVEEFGIAQTTKTVTGVALIVVQSTLSGVLAILVVWNGINACFKMNPHRQRRKELEKLRDVDDLTPLDARNSLLLNRSKTDLEASMYSIPAASSEKQAPYGSSQPYYVGDQHLHQQPASHTRDPSTTSSERTLIPGMHWEERQSIISNAAPVAMGGMGGGPHDGLPSYDRNQYNYQNAGYRGT